MNIPSDRRYAESHEWAQIVGEVDGRQLVRMGISDFAQDALGDVVYVDLPDVDAEFAKGDQIAEVESTKSVADVYAPVTGTVTAVNEDLDETPEQVNIESYGGGWFLEITMDDPAEFESLMSADQYIEQVSS